MANLSSIIPPVNVANASGVLPVGSGGTGSTTSTGSGSVVLANSPSLVTPALGAATATSLTASGLVESTTGGFKFPDGTTQTTAASPSAMELISTVNASGAASIDFTGLTSAYSHYIIVFSTPGQSVIWRALLSVNNGVSYASANYYQNLITAGSNLVTCSSSDAATFIGLGTGGSGYIKFTSPGNSGTTQTNYGQTLYSEVNGITSSKYLGSGRYLYAANAIRIVPFAATATGTFWLYGVKA